MPGHPPIYRLLFLLQKLFRPVLGYSGRNIFLGQLCRHIDETFLRSQARQFASKLATPLPPQTVTRCDGSQCSYSSPSWPSGTVTGTAAPLRATTWQLTAETVGVVEHSHDPHDPGLFGINTGVGVTCSFYPHSAFFFLRSAAPCASPPDRGTEKESRRRRPPACRRLRFADVWYHRRRRRRSSLRHC
jgi:hypothetical protein